MGLGSPAKLVDAALGVAVKDDREKQEAGREVFLSDPEPWSEPVDGSKLATDISATISKYVALPARTADTIALWILHCYTISAVFVSPILAITSPLKQCGKTTLLEVVGALVPRLLLASSITASALFRSVEKYEPTLLVDEADTFLANHEELRGVLNAGHTRNTARVVRTVGDKHEPRVFSTWCAKAIALIGRLPETLEDRSIVISMRRRAPSEQVERLRRDRLHRQLEPLRQQAARWTADHQKIIRDADPAVPDSISDRAQDNWRPLLAIAEALGGDWPETARAAVLALGGVAIEVDNAPRVQLLADIRDLFAERSVDRLSSEEIVETLTKMEDRPWPEWRQGKPLSKNQLARLLKPFGVRPRTVRTNGSTPRGYQLDDFQDAFARYLRQPNTPDQSPGTDPEHVSLPDTPPQTATTATSAESQASLPLGEPQQTPPCCGLQTSEKARDSANVADVALRQGGTGEGEPSEPVEEEEFEV
jgi:putative DNA primase/helicase